MSKPDLMQNRAVMAVAESGDGHLERIDPAVDAGTLVASEHLLRYHWAAEIVVGKSVLDAGCGTGYGVVLMAQAGAERVVGVDIAGEAVSRAHELAKDAEFVVGDVRKLPFDDQAFDVVTCFEVIEHVDGAEDVLPELKRVLRPGGVLLLSSPNRDAYPAGNPHHVSEFLPDELRDKLQGLFSKVALYRQDSLLASTITDAQAPPRADVSVELELPAHFGAELKPGAQPYFLIAASAHELPKVRNRAVFGDLFEVNWWEEEQVRLARLLAEAQTRLAELELLRARARDAEAALLKLESKRAAEVELVRQAEADVEAAKAAFLEANETIQAMHRTKVWRLGAAWWRLRERLFRRGG
jgi:ubiquinone/menaquinone biosynthesis C-methylase UbiE